MYLELGNVNPLWYLKTLHLLHHFMCKYFTPSGLLLFCYFLNVMFLDLCNSHVLFLKPLLRRKEIYHTLPSPPEFHGFLF